MSPRAACRLESLGFTEVYDYVTGLADWTANGLPTEGKIAGVFREGVVRRGVLRARDALRTDTPTCGLGERVGDVAERVKIAGQRQCVVTSEDGVVLGRLRGQALKAHPDAAVESVMESGPTTIRPDVSLEEFTEHMRARRVGSVVVTTSTGHLIGVLYREDAEKKLRQALE